MKQSIASDYKKRLCFLIYEIISKTLYMLCLRYISEGMKGKGGNENEIRKRDEKVRGEEIWKWKRMIKDLRKEKGWEEI